MTKTILLTFTLLSCTAWMAAQSTPPSAGSPDASSPSAGQATGQAGSEAGQSTAGAQSSGDMNGSAKTTIRGCLSGSNGGYTLTDAAGTAYQLSGDTSKLASHVNNEVELKGSASASSGASGSQTATSTGAGQMFNVSKVKKVSSTCSTSK
jgi:hypothetical protein